MVMFFSVGLVTVALAKMCSSEPIRLKEKVVSKSASLPKRCKLLADNPNAASGAAMMKRSSKVIFVFTAYAFNLQSLTV